MTLMLQEPKPPQALKHEDDEFVVIRNVPVWKEHTNRDGETFGPEELRQVCDRCNERIEDTDDFAPIVIRHTVDDGSRDPKVIGFAGPYRIGTVGNVKPKAAILATFRIYREDIADLKRYPRLSVEYWADESNPTSGYFDPISLLGAETPELDLGVRYSKEAGPRGRVMRYSKVTRFEATAPGGSNTFVPSTDDKEKSEIYLKDGGSMALDEQDLAQIVEALKPAVEEAVHSAVAVLNAPEEPIDDDLDTEEVTPYGQMEGFADAEDDEGADAFFGGLEDDDRTSLASELEGDEDEVRKEKMSAYMARYDCKSGDHDEVVDDEFDDDGPAKYKKQRDDLRVRYQREVTKRRGVEAERDKLKASHRVITAEKRKAVRYQKLTELSSAGYVFDLDAEVTEVANLGDEAFDGHCDRIVDRYQRVPFGSLPMSPTPRYTGEGEEGNDKKRSRYAKEARVNVLAAQERGDKLDYTAEYNRLLEEDTEA